MGTKGRGAACERAQSLMWDAMERVGDDNDVAAALCRRALEVYPDCVDALTMLAELECERVIDLVEAARHAVEAGRRDLGARCFQEDAGHFWGFIETRPFMRAMVMLADALLQLGTPEATDEAIGIHEEMLRLNPDDNQGVRDCLAGSYLARKRYAEAEALIARYPDDWLAAPAWARVLLAHATKGETRAAELLKEARSRNRHVEKYLSGATRRPRARPPHYSPGDDSEAVFCADTLWAAWKAHPQARKWLMAQGDRKRGVKAHKKAARGF